LTHAGKTVSEQGLKRFKMHRTPVPVLEQHPLAVSSYQTAKKFGCEGTKREAYKAGFVSFQDLTIRNNEQGKPYFIPSEKLRL
jgi:hypothetical protein